MFFYEESRENPEIINLCRNLAKYRRDHGLSEHEMAGKLSLRAMDIRSIEIGVLPWEMTVDSLLRAARLLGVNMSALFRTME